MIVLRDVEFDWDDGNISKIQQRFTLTEVEDFFVKDLFVIRDKSHSEKEQRYIAIGLGPRCFTLRSGKIRIISARFMRTKEAMNYENFKEKYSENIKE